ncbi:uncharacterized protein LOC124253172 [Haliotis rubra]|uniref:uncharacterized protein LOC124253172 n=1 Tax=Haliotis rubra TaxID=36100 RepID=UPI001EE51686|nr:uncharacterized protein LOC124253172 [Haliotis rubra]
MLKNEIYHRDYVAFMNSILLAGYACEVPKSELCGQPGHIWYLPHHGVYHPRKPNKIRVVFDCSAKFDGVSINDVLLQGPDLTHSFIGVLTRFRKEDIAFMGDIEAMFHQVKVPKEQQDYLRFLWWPDGDVDSDLKEYRMTVHTFGTISSPSIANYALKASAHKSEGKYDSDVAYTIYRNFYVDDCLKSLQDEKSAVTLISQLRSACAEGGFNLTKFTSNSKHVLSSLPPEHCSKDIQAIDLSCDDIPMERALGMQVHIQSDSFKFSVDLPEKPATRRGILSTMSSLYDPLGLVSPVLLPAKKILQDLCKDKSLDWDDHVEKSCCDSWNRWLCELDLLKDLEVRRCLKPPAFGNVVSCQLHIFSDASVTGYGCAAYIRLCNEENIHTALVMGKARLAPLKVITIPRLELTAATTAVKIGTFLQKELDMDIDSTTYYTDSTTVLHYITNERNRYPVFVTNRVKLIRDYTDPQQWKYVYSQSNPADIASRGTTCAKFLKSSLWFDGPPFLRCFEKDWPQQPCIASNETSETVAMTMMKSVVAGTLASSEEDTVCKLLQHYSSWHRLQRAVAIYRRFFAFLQYKAQTVKVSNLTFVPLTVQEVSRAREAILRFVQHQEYKSEMNLLLKAADERGRAQNVSRSSPLYKLNPVIRDGFLCVGGRLRRAEISEDMKHPIILPQKNHVSMLIIRDTHDRLGHVGRNHVLSALRAKYWITRANSAIRSVMNKCVFCRRFKTPTSTQMMSDLPACRVTPAGPFTYTGIDFFGPHVVKEGRKCVKRYGVLFTCLSSRAVHIETANSLDTSSFINSLRRFIARRGPVQEIFCDNGTNFVGGARELKESLDQLDQEKVHSDMLHKEINFSFNPPSASHMGGAWERLIRSVRSILNPMLHEFGSYLDDELYRTLLCEIEAILNSRPLTTVSGDPDDLHPPHSKSHPHDEA